MIKNVKIIRKNLKQFDCGIVAAFNALSWCKKPQKYEIIEFAAMAMFGYDSNEGIRANEFEKLITYFGAPVKKMKSTTAEEIQDSVHMGKAVILTYRLTGDPLGHMVMLLLDKNGKVKTINSDMRKITWDDLASDISAGGSEWFFAWELPNRGLL